MRFVKNFRILAPLLPLTMLLAACVTDGTAGGAAAPTPKAMAGTNWGAVTITGLPAVASNTSTILFVDGDKVQGNTGCNTFSGNVKVEGGQMTIGPLVTTKRACIGPMQEQEQRFMTALRDARSMKMMGEDLVLVDAKGDALTRLRKM